MPTKTSNVVSISSLYRKGARAYMTKMSFAELHNLSINNRYPHQRPEDLRVDKPHVNSWGARHHIFAVIAYPNGEIQPVDGYTRLLNIRTGRLEIPADVLQSGADVFVHSVEDADQAFAVYESYNSRDSSKTPAEYIVGALAANNAAPTTKWLRSAKSLATAIGIAFEGVRIADKSGTYRRNTARAIKVATFAEAIKILDSIVPNYEKFPGGFLAGALLALHRDGEDAKRFFDQYNVNSFVKGDQMWHMNRALEENREKKGMTSSNANRHISIALGCYSSWKKKGAKVGGRPKALDRTEFMLSA